MCSSSDNECDGTHSLLISVSIAKSLPLLEHSVISFLKHTFTYVTIQCMHTNKIHEICRKHWRADANHTH